MDYKKIYYKLIESRKLLERKRNKLFYYEKHHIVPTSIGGNNDFSNLVLLTAKEHFIAHLLLTKFTSGKERSKMIYALWRLTNGKSSVRKPSYSSRQYEVARTLYIDSITNRKQSPETIEKRVSKFRGRKHSPASLKKMSESKKGKVSKLKGKTYAEIYGDKLEETKKNREGKLKGKTYEEIFGLEKAKEMREKCRLRENKGLKKKNERKKLS